MNDAADASPGLDKYGILGLSVVSRHEAEGIQAVLQSLRSGSRKIRVVQLFTALTLLFFLMTGMLPSPVVIISAAAVFIAVIFVGKRLLTTAVSEIEVILRGTDFGDYSDMFSGFLSDPKFLNRLAESGISTVGANVVNIEGDSVVLCEQATE